MCGRYGIVLGKPGTKNVESTRKLAQHYATNCPAFGQPMPPQPEESRFTVAMPDLGARQPNLDPITRDACKSCASCVNYTPELDVVSQLGWTAGFCHAKGKLIPSNQQSYEARGCEYRKWGTVRLNLGPVTLFPEYEDAFNFGVDPVQAFFKSRDNFIEPHEYPTDREVAQEDRDHGVRAWRKVKDPTGSGNEVFLPIYDLEFFSEDERNKVPKSGDDEHPELYVDHFGGAYLAAVAWTELDETPALWGEAGTGKTELFRYLAWLMCLPFERISITGQTDIDDLAGKMLFEPGKGTYFQYGRLPRAWNKPCVVVVDEPNTGPPEVWQFIRPLTDNSKQMVLDMNEGERIKRHDDCYLGMAMNPSWDPKNVGTMQIGDADANRLFHLHLNLPPEELEREIIKQRILVDGWEIDKDRLDMLMRVAKDLRGLAADDELPITWGIRPQIKVARALRWFDPITAYRRAVADYLEPSAQESLLAAVRSHNGE
jgi:MoxR-like ATPase